MTSKDESPRSEGVQRREENYQQKEPRRRRHNFSITREEPRITNSPGRNEVAGQMQI